jgi:uncharacterized membrane protein YkvA (DUF1232 family)
MTWKQRARQLRSELHVFYYVSKHPRAPWYARAVAACSIGYFFSPIQLIPNFIPVIGFIDDLVVLFLGAKLIQRITPPNLLAECREGAEFADISGPLAQWPHVRRATCPVLDDLLPGPR